MSGKPSSVASLIVGVCAAGALAYAIYFDHRRRTSPEFRRQLRRQRKETAEQEELQEKKMRENKVGQVRDFVLAQGDFEAEFPAAAAVPEREQYFTEQVRLGEVYQSTEALYLDAAFAYYKALSVFPQPTDLLRIFNSTLPEVIYLYVVIMITVKPPALLKLILTSELADAPAQPDLD